MSLPRLPSRWSTVLRLAASVAIVAFVLQDVDPHTLATTLGQVAPGWFVLALLLRVVVVLSRIFRIGIGLTHWDRPAWAPLFRIGVMAALLNQVIPARGGDLVALGLMKRDLGVPLGAGASAILTTNLVTASVTSVFYAGVLVMGATRWREVVDDAALDSLSWVALGLLVGVAVVALGVRLAARARPASGVGTSLRDLALDARTGMAMDWRLGTNLGLGFAQLLVALCSIGCLLPALGLDIRMPVAGIVLFLLLTNVVAAVLPEALGASSATSGLVVLTALGATTDEAAAFAGLAWAVRVLPLVGLGLWPLASVSEPLNPGD